MGRFLTVCIAASLLAGLAGAAEDRPTDQNVQSVEPEVAFVLDHVPGTGDIVQMSFVGDVYDEAALRACMETLSVYLGSAPSDYQYILPVEAGNPTKVMFVAQGLVDPSIGDVRLQPLVRAFMAGKGRTVKAFSVRVMGIAPSAYSTLASYTSKVVALKAFFDPATTSLEYRILVLVDDPSKVEIPARHEPIPEQQEATSPSQTPTALLVALLVLAGASAGALVYFALLGRRA